MVAGGETGISPAAANGRLIEGQVPQVVRAPDIGGGARGEKGALRELRREVASLRDETRPLLHEMRASTSEARDAVDTARSDLERFDRVLGSAEAISDAVEGSGRAARTAFSAPVIKLAGLATGTHRAVRRLRGRDTGAEIVHVRHERRRA